ncbi:MAG: oligosaccharide flippase family protein [Bacteroidia bacterium]|nr:oligosaccharide flippase family protein [Bacteroidota bacterium]MBP6412440.1 oligosaccharide flippase family protein [Bacteroidia bacterium]
MLAFLPTASRILLLPVYLHYLAPEEFAIIGLNTLIASLLPLFMTLGLEAAFIRYFFEYKSNEKILRSYFSTIALSIFLISLLIGLLVTAFGNPLFHFAFKNPYFTFFPFGISAVLFSIVASQNLLVYAYYRNMQNVKSYTAFALSIFLSSTIAEAAAIVVFKTGAEGVIWTKLIATALISMVAWFTLFRKTGISFDKRFLPSSLKYALPMLPYSLSALVFTSFDRVMIENRFNLASLAVYNLSAAIANITDSILFAIQSATYPTVYAMLKKDPNQNSEEISKTYRIIGLAVLLIICILVALSPFAVINFLKPVYVQSLSIIPILLMAYFFRYLYIVFVEPLFFFKDTKKLPWLNIIAGATTIAGNFILLPYFGLIGSAMTTILARLLQLSLTLYWYKRVSNIRFKLGYLFPVMVILGIALLLASYVNTVFPNVHWLVYFVNTVPLILLGFFVIFYLFEGNLKPLFKFNFQPIRHRV